MPRKTKALSQRQVAKLHGFRSGFEQKIAEYLQSINRFEGYECETLIYEQPAQKRRYTPDFVLIKSNGEKMYIETKGRWVTADRMKHRLLQQTRPELDIRLVFQNPKTKINKGSKTTYAMYCEKYDIKYSQEPKTIPKDWLEE